MRNGIRVEGASSALLPFVSSVYRFNSPFAHFSRGFGLGLYQWDASSHTYPTSILSPWTVPFHVIFPFVGLVVTASNWIVSPFTVDV